MDSMRDYREINSLVHLIPVDVIMSFGDHLLFVMDSFRWF